MVFDPNALLKKNKEKGDNLVKSLNITNNKPKTTLGKVEKEDILNIVRAKGPITPNGIKKDIKVDSYLISAILSELVNANILKITSVKKGTSIFYYLPSQKAKLESLISYLNEKDQRTVALLKEKKVLQDKPQELLIRVSLRKIKDYAIPINIRISENEVKLFWKYFLINDEEAKGAIRNILKPIVKNVIPKEETIDHSNELNKTKDQSFDHSNELNKTKDQSFDHSNELNKSIEKQKPIKQEKVVEISKEKETFKTIEKDEKLSEHSIDEKLIGTKFYEDLKQSFSKKDIIIENAKQIRKNKELDLIILVRTSLGKSRYYAKYKNKKRNNDADISNAIVIAQSKHLPAAYITTGEIAKKTRENINTLFHNVMIVERFE